MKLHNIHGLIVFMFLACLAGVAAEDIQLGGRLPQGGTNVVLWWELSSAGKVRPDTKPAEQLTAAVQMRCARNEYESVQVVLRPVKALHHLTIQAGVFVGPGLQVVSSNEVEILEATYLNVSIQSDGSGKAGPWPDPLIPLRGAIDLPAGTNQAFWIRVNILNGITSGIHRGTLRMRSDEWDAEVPLELTVCDYGIQDHLTGQTAYGFSPGEVFRYQCQKRDLISNRSSGAGKRVQI